MKKKTANPDAAAERALAALRGRIDRLDVSIVRALNRRAELAQRIAAVKRASGVAIHVPARERAVLQHVAEVSEGPLGASELRPIYRAIMAAARRVERGV